MSTKTVIVWLGIALILGAGAFYLVRRPHGGAASAGSNAIAAGELLLEIQPGTLSALSVLTPDQRGQWVERAAEPGEWVVKLTDADGSTGPAWPVLPARMRSIVSLLSTARSEGPPSPAAAAGTALGERPTVVVLYLDGGERIELRLAERTLGGTGVVEVRRRTGEAEEPGGGVEFRTAMVAANLIDVLRNPGPRAWRDNLALPGAGAEASRIRVEGADGRSLALVRVRGRWHLTEPVAAPANAAKVTQLISALQGLAISDFLDERRVDGSLTKLDSPGVRIRVETDQRVAAESPAGGAPPAVRTRVQELAIGGPADSTGKNLFARISTDSSERVVAIDATSLAAALTADPVAYISPQATTVVAADVGVMSISPPGERAEDALGQRRFKRSLGSWAEILPGGREAQLADGDVSAVNEVLAFLSSRSAATMHVIEPAGYRALGTILLESAGGSPLDTIELGAAADGALVLRSGQVRRVYSADAAPKLLRDWHAAAGGRPPPTLALPPGDVDPTK